MRDPKIPPLEPWLASLVRREQAFGRTAAPAKAAAYAQVQAKLALASAAGANAAAAAKVGAGVAKASTGAKTALLLAKLAALASLGGALVFVVAARPGAAPSVQQPVTSAAAATSSNVASPAITFAPATTAPLAADPPNAAAAPATAVPALPPPNTATTAPSTPAPAIPATPAPSTSGASSRAGISTTGEQAFRPAHRRTSAPIAEAAHSALPAPNPSSRAAPAAVESATAHDEAPAAGRDDGTLADERRLLDHAQRALAQRDPSGALADVGQHARRFPNGQLQAEREAIAIRALVLAGRAPEAEARARRFRAAFPNNLFGPAVESAVGKEKMEK